MGVQLEALFVSIVTRHLENICYYIYHSFRHTVKQSLTIVVLTLGKTPGIQVVSVTVTVEDLLARTMGQENGMDGPYLYFALSFW